MTRDNNIATNSRSVQTAAAIMALRHLDASVGWVSFLCPVYFGQTPNLKTLEGSG